MHKKGRRRERWKRGIGLLLTTVMLFGQFPALAQETETETGISQNFETEYTYESETETDTAASAEIFATTELSGDTTAGANLKAAIETEDATENDTKANVETELDPEIELVTQTELEPETEQLTQTEPGLETEQLIQTELNTETDTAADPIMLQAENNRIEVEAVCADGSSFPADAWIRLRSLEEMAASEADIEAAVLAYQEILQSYAVPVLLNWYLEQAEAEAAEYSADIAALSEDDLKKACAAAVTLVDPTEFGLYCSDGSICETGELNLTVTDFAESSYAVSADQNNVHMLFLTFDSRMRAACFEDVVKDDLLQNWQIHLDRENAPQFFSFALFDETAFWQEAEYLVQEQAAGYESGSEKESEQKSENEEDAGTEGESEKESEVISEAESEHESECETENELSLLPSVFAFDDTQQGIPCTQSGEYTTVVPGEYTFSSKYSFIRGSASSSVEYWYDSSQVVKGVRESSGVVYLMPLTDAAKGRFGFRITNVAYSREEQCSLDLFVTVTDYDNYSYDKNGNIVDGVYPFVAVTEDLKIGFVNGLPAFELSCDLVKSGTNDRVKGDYRFMWLDIDGAQKYGFEPKDGSMDALYCVNGSDVNCGTETVFGHAYHMVYGKFENASSSDLISSVLFEVSDMSGFRIAVKQNGNVTLSESTIRGRYEDAKDGSFSAATGAVMVWNGTAYGPTELPYPLNKYVSNDGTSWSSSNTLETISSEYWYMLELYVPQESSEYYYSELRIEDVLPAGADYVGDFSAVCAETGETVSGFVISASKDAVEIDASALISSSQFYGWTYCLKFKVKMDPSEISPACHDNLAEYTVKNQAELIGRHKTDTQQTLSISDPVTTTASKLLTGRIVLRKTDENGNPLADAVFSVKAAEDICAFDGTVLIAKGKEVASVTTGADGSAVVKNCYPGTYTVTETRPPAGYVCSSQKQTVRVPDADDSGAVADSIITTVNEPTCVILKKISAPEEGINGVIPVEGAVFCIWAEDQKSTDGKSYTTDKNGEIAVRGLKPGTYSWQEIKTSPGYVLDSTIRTFTIDEMGLCNGTHSCQITCENAFIELQISKTDRATGTLVSGAQLQLMKQDGTVVDTWISSGEPYVIRRIPAGSYILTELKAPSGYKKGTPLEITVKESAEVQYAALTNCRYVDITLTKSIQAEDIVWAHGNPTFTFCVEGTDLDGEEHCYYKTVEFEKLTTADSGLVSLSAYFSVPAGTYRAYETNVIRYKLSSIEAVQNGAAAGVGVKFFLEHNESGAATFINRKNTDQGLTDTDYVKNVIIP